MNKPACIETVITVAVVLLIGALLALLCGCAGQNLTINLGAGSADGGAPQKTVTADTTADLARGAQAEVHP